MSEKFSPEQLTHLNSQATSDARLIHNGAEYIQDSDKEPRLEVSRDEFDQIHREMENDVFRKTIEYEILSEQLNMLAELQNQLGYIYMEYAVAGNMPQNHTDINSLYKNLSINPPANDKEGVGTYQLIETKITNINNIITMLASSPKIRIGETVKVEKTSGAIEPNWKIINIWQDGRFNLKKIDEDQYLLVPIEEIIELNRQVESPDSPTI